jgi:hypothetical protein
MVSLVSFFVDRCCKRRRSVPKACDLDFRVNDTSRKLLSKMERDYQTPIEELVLKFNKWKVLDGKQRGNNLTNLLAWLTLDRGFKYFPNYDRFKQMADQLSITSSEENFWETFASIDQEEGGEEYQLRVAQAEAARRKSFSNIGLI